eukprot:CAMPEP_0119388456 /NCGR_PEP_ID=MMETSP1334-20130426/104999_1 /TAXON_ID=127549 /ORGANISM="Calcidiscus leptoporus, Strain RCC1130" /LENGTH=137 /DNA_ID=CAMNT_0007410445 /DNA_START=268 /DNA_END=682 /DNA_ORIENTATION=+
MARLPALEIGGAEHAKRVVAHLVVGENARSRASENGRVHPVPVVTRAGLTHPQILAVPPVLDELPLMRLDDARAMPASACVVGDRVLAQVFRRQHDQRRLAIAHLPQPAARQLDLLKEKPPPSKFWLQYATFAPSTM